MHITFIQDIIDILRGKKKKNKTAKNINVEKLIKKINNIDIHNIKKCDNIYEYNYDSDILALSELFDAFLKKFNIDIIHNNIFNYKLYLPANSVISKRIITFNYPVDSYPELCLFEKYNKKFDVIFDVGANRGRSGCYFAKIAKQLYAFEPMPNLIEEIKKNIKLNNLSNVNIIEKAVSNCCKKEKFCVYELDGQNSLLHHDQSKLLNEVDVDVITLDSFCEENNIKHIDMCSIDVEGFEYQVLEGTKNMLEQKAIDVILFEVVKGYINQDKIDALFEYIKSFDYEIFNLELEKVESTDLVYQQDLLAMPKGKKDLLFK